MPPGEFGKQNSMFSRMPEHGCKLATTAAKEVHKSSPLLTDMSGAAHSKPHYLATKALAKKAATFVFNQSASLARNSCKKHVRICKKALPMPVSGPPPLNATSWELDGAVFEKAVAQSIKGDSFGSFGLHTRQCRPQALVDGDVFQDLRLHISRNAPRLETQLDEVDLGVLNPR